MKTVIYNYSESKLNKSVTNLSLRVAYLFGNDVKAAGSIWGFILLEEFFNSFKLKQKIKMLQEHYELEEDKLVLENLLSVLKSSNTVKHKSGQALAAQKKIEIVIEKIFKDWVNSIAVLPDVQNYIELKKLCKEDTFDFYQISDENPEDDNEPHIPASKIFLRTLEGFEEGKGIFFLPADFFQEYLSKKLEYYSSSDVEAANPQNTYFEGCFNFFDLRVLTAAELEAARLQISSEVPSFMKVLDEWIILCSSSANTTERLSFFKNNVLSEVKKVEKAITENKLLQHYFRLQNDEYRFQFLIGEMPVKVLFEYYRHWDVINDDTGNKIITESQNNERFNVRWPVMALKSDYNANTDIKENKKAFKSLFRQGKKSITID